MTPEALLAWAERLHAHTGEDPIAFRQVVRCVYYTAFHKARTLVGRLSPSAGKLVCARGGAHQALCKLLEPNRIREMLTRSVASRDDLIDAGERLEELRIRRETADYDLDAAFTEQDGEEALQMAKEATTSIGYVVGASNHHAALATYFDKRALEVEAMRRR